MLLEEPDLAYVDESKNAVNLIALVSRSTFQAEMLFKLDKTEVPNCVYYNSNCAKDASVVGNDLIMIGTAYLNFNEQVPSQGRILFLDPKSLQLVQQFKLDGSV